MGPPSPRPRDSDIAHDESTPLFARSNTADSSPQPQPGRLYIILVVAAIILLIDFGNSISLPAQTQILEDNICQRYYAGIAAAINGTLDCKINAVQSEVAFVSGWMDTVEVIPSLFLALPYGVIADRWGRRPVLKMAVAGILATETYYRIVCWWPNVFPPRILLLGTVFMILGGGSGVASTMVLVIAADVYAQAERLNVFFFLTAAVLISEFVGAPVGAALTEIEPWLALLLSLALVVMGSLATFIVPETLVKRNHDPESPHEQMGDGTDDEPLKQVYLIERVSDWRRRVYAYTHFIWSSRNIPLLLLMFFVGTLGRQSSVFLILYVSKKFGWSIAKASYFITARAATKTLLVLAILPALGILLTKRLHISHVHKDLFLSRGQILTMVLGMSVIAWAPSPYLVLAGLIIFALGSAFDLTVRSLVTALVHQDHFATLYTSITVVESIGVVVAGPMLAAAFSRGLELGGRWMSLPFVVACGLYVLATFAIFMVKLPRAEEREGGEEEEEEEEEEQVRED